MSEDSPAGGDSMRSSVPLETDRPLSSKNVFVSYASQDAAVANSVVEALEKHGMRCWIAPRNVVPGEFYADSIVHAIDAAAVLVLVLSKNAAVSHHILREVERASAKRHPVISLRIDLAQLPAGLEYFLNTSQWLDASDGEVSRTFPKLVEAVHKALAGAPNTATGNHAESMLPLESVRAPQRSPNGRVAMVLGLVVVAVGGFAIDRWWSSKNVAAHKPVTAATTPAAPVAAPTISEQSVAVLPFVDMSEKQDQEYFSDGLSEELIDMLTKVPALRVPARTSSFYFKRKPTTIADIAKALGVTHVLEGSVRKSGKTLRITAQLIRADNGFHVWSETYDRKLDDIFKTQDEIAAAVVGALKASLIGLGPKQAVSATNAEAYRLYLQGRAINRSATNKAQYDMAADYMRRAIRADPKFAEAWAWLAIVLGNEIIIVNAPAGPLALEMRSATQRALELAPDLPVVQGAIGAIAWSVDWDWQAGVAAFQKGYDLDPSDAGSAKVLADALLIVNGKSDLVLGLYKKALDLDPINSTCYGAVGWYYWATGSLAEAETAIRKAIDLQPDLINVHTGLGVVLLARGRPADALAEFQRDPDPMNQREGAALAYVALGRKADADTALSTMLRLDAMTGAFSIAEVYAYRGEADQAFSWLERAYRQRDFGVASTNRDPLLRNLYHDPRYQAFLRKLKLPE